eukprot:m.190702 g.190702  ORF g.190702 m.190702 type:complete len:116 (-) comp18096_c0_seq1:505-852(-)
MYVHNTHGSRHPTPKDLVYWVHPGVAMASTDGPTLKVKAGDWIECDEIVRELIKNFQETHAIGGGDEFIEAELEGGLFVKKDYAPLIVDKVNQWIDDNAQIVDKSATDKRKDKDR